MVQAHKSETVIRAIYDGIRSNQQAIYLICELLLQKHDIDKRLGNLEDLVQQIARQQDEDHRSIEQNLARNEETKEAVRIIKRRLEFELPQPNWED